jgi:hypothetical protein
VGVPSVPDGLMQVHRVRHEPFVQGATIMDSPTFSVIGSVAGNDLPLSDRPIVPTQRTRRSRESQTLRDFTKWCVIVAG